MSHRLPVADIQFISDFAAFCRTKGDEGYDATDAEVCALAQFGYPDVGGDDLACVPYVAFRAAVPNVVVDERTYCTFSALADRLEALIADAPAIAKATGA